MTSDLSSRWGRVLTVAMPPQDSESARWFSAEVLPHEALLRAWLQNRFPQLADIDDIVQESYRRVLVARDRREVRRPKAFVFATARNLALDHFRRCRTAPTESLGDREDLSVLDESANVAETVAHRQEIELMTEAIRSLPDRCRRVMTLRNVYGLGPTAIAAELEISVRTVETQLAIGLRRCTEYIHRRQQP